MFDLICPLAIVTAVGVSLLSRSKDLIGDDRILTTLANYVTGTYLLALLDITFVS